MSATILAFSWLNENLSKVITENLNAILDFYGSSINNIFYTMVKISNADPSVNDAMNFTMTFATVLVTLLIIKSVLGTYVFETSGDPDESPINILVRATQALAVILGTSFIFNQMLELSMKFYGDLVGTVNISVVNGMTAALSLIKGLFNPLHGVFALTLTLLTVGYIVFSIIAGIRGGEVILMKLALPLFACDLVGSQRERFNAFMTGFISAFFYNSVQILCFMLSVKNLMEVNIGSGESTIRTAVWLILAIKSPKMFEKFAYTTGISRSASSGLRMVAQMLVVRR
ncbi:MAG: hypothetical protein H2184_15830 [Candidatus Galacturonibacter soehngenii]|nr:hypothetical protein [Candidatus Galacturonibacter soehngenii]